ncbi:hypothetical protein HBI81_077230 [Parastagonospora nodorum]|nr:hypothetical protein HBI81_077230 [Parastagonospora nodorum]
MPFQHSDLIHNCTGKIPSFPHFSSTSLDQWKLIPPQAKKKHVYIWHCCHCGQSSIPIATPGCPGCGYGRCAYCKTTRVQVRSHEPLSPFLSRNDPANPLVIATGGLRRTRLPILSTTSPQQYGAVQGMRTWLSFEHGHASRLQTTAGGRRMRRYRRSHSNLGSLASHARLLPLLCYPLIRV